MEAKWFITNIEYLNIRQLKALHRIELDRLRNMLARYASENGKASPRRADSMAQIAKVDMAQLSMAIEVQKVMLNDISGYIQKLESFFTGSTNSTNR